jgi:DHA1 family multidrug resistance protein-like MFS transporter
MRQRLPVILNLAVVSGLVILGVSIISPVLPQYALSFNIPVSLTGWAVSAFAMARMVTDVPAGVLADRYGRKGNMLIGLFLIVGASIVAGTARSYGWLIFGRIVEGLGSAMYITSTTTWVAQISSGEHRGRIMALYSGIIMAGTSFGPSIGGFAAAHFGLNAPFFVYAGVVALGIVATVPLKEPPRETGGPDRPDVSLRDVPAVLANVPFLMVCGSVLVTFFLRAGVRSTLVPLYASLNLGMSEDKIGLMLTAAAVVTTLLAYPSGWLSDKVGRKIPILACLLLSSAAIMLIPFQTGAGGLTGALAFYGLATGLQGSIAAWPADVADKDKLGTSMGVYRVMGDVGMVIGPISVSYVTQYTGHGLVTYAPFLVPAALAIVVGIMLLWAPDPARQRLHPPRA